MNLIIYLVSVLGILFSASVAREAVILNDDNFEELTQATSGSNTGDWLIMFCEKSRFKKCRDIIPFWNELSEVLHGKTTVAYVDV